MVISSTSTSIRSYHWLFAIAFAILAHLVLLMKYPAESTAVTQDTNVQEAIVISLKSMKTLPTAPIVTPAIPVLPAPESIPQKIEPIRSYNKRIEKPVKKPKLTERKRVNITPPPTINEPAKIVETVTESMPKNSPSSQAVSNTLSDAIPIGMVGAESDDIKLKYQTKLAAWLAKHKRYPKLAKRRKQEGVVKVKFQIDAQGKLLSHQLLERSSYDSLNKEVERMLKRASPMPPIPAALRTERELYTYTIPVRFELRVVN